MTRPKPPEGFPEYWPGKMRGTIKESPNLYYHPVPEDETFHIGQGYDDTAAAMLECAACNSRVFNVGEGDYFTALRCVNCEWEVCIHSG